jgi:hypothetical protein
LYETYTVLPTWEDYLLPLATQLSKKMASYTTYYKVFIETFNSSSGARVTVARHYHRQLSVRVAPLRDSIYWIGEQFYETGSVCVINVRRDVNRFDLRLHKVRDLRGHHMKMFGVTNFPRVLSNL